MSITNGYITLTTFKAIKDISSSDSLDDAQIERFIEDASRYIDNATGRRFYTTTNDETRVFRAASAIRVYPWDLISITSLKTDDDGDRTYEMTWSATDYDLLPENAALDGQPYTIIQITPNGNNSFPLHPKGVQIVGKFGYSSATPKIIEDACLSIALRMYQNRFGNTVDGNAIVTAAGTAIMSADIPKDALAKIQQMTRFS